jgi:hypothetical protein
MKPASSVQFRFRRFAAVLAAAACLMPGAFCSAATPSAAVVGIEPTRVADLVLLQGGFDVGFRQGMVCRVKRGATDIAEVLLVELRPTCSAALILSVAPKQSIRTGDVASIKVLKT